MTPPKKPDDGPPGAPLTEDDIYGLLFDTEEWAQYETGKLAVSDAIQSGQEEVTLPTDLAAGLFYADYFDLPPLLAAWNRICDERGASAHRKERGRKEGSESSDR